MAFLFCINDTEAIIPYNGTGTFTVVYSFVTDAANGILVRADRMDTQFADVATALSNCVTRDGQSAPTANLPMGGFKLTGLGNGAAPTDAVNYGQVFGSPAFTGTPTAPTAAVGTNTDQIATMAALINQAFASSLPAISAGVTDYFPTNNGTAGSWSNLLKAGTIRFADSADTTKRLAFNVSGVTAGQTRTLTAPDEDLTLAGRGANTFTGKQTLSGAAIDEAKGADIASASTVNLDTATGNLVHITGTTAITAITLASGASRDVVFDGALTLTHNATTLILPGGANITTAAGDRATFRGDGSGNVRCLHYTKASGQAVIAPAPGLTLLSTVSASNSATVDIETTFDSTYDTYLIVASGVTVQTDAVQFLCRMKVGGAYDSGPNYPFHSNESHSGGATYVGVNSGGATAIALTNSAGNAAGKSLNFKLSVYTPTSTSLSKLVDWTGAAYTSDGRATTMQGVGRNTATTALTGIRFLASSGNIVSGSFRLYGIKNS